MRWWWLSIAIACSAPPHTTTPQPPPPPPATPDARPAGPVVRVHRPIVLAVLGLETLDPVLDPETTRVARDLTLYLRNRAREDAHTQLTSEKELVDEKLLDNCDDEAPACMAFVGRGLDAEYVLFGRVTRNAARLDIALKLLEVASQTVWSWNGVTTGERAALESLANGAYDELTSHVPM